MQLMFLNATRPVAALANPFALAAAIYTANGVADISYGKFSHCHGRVYGYRHIPHGVKLGLCGRRMLADSVA
jgi:hypothetical protein